MLELRIPKLCVCVREAKSQGCTCQRNSHFQLGYNSLKTVLARNNVRVRNVRNVRNVAERSDCSEHLANIDQKQFKNCQNQPRTCQNQPKTPKVNMLKSGDVSFRLGACIQGQPGSGQVQILALYGSGSGQKQCIWSKMNRVLFGLKLGPN